MVLDGCGGPREAGGLRLFFYYGSGAEREEDLEHQRWRFWDEVGGCIC